MRKLIWICSTMIAVLAICVWLSSLGPYGTSYPIIFAAPALGLIAFFGVLSVSTDTSATKTISDSGMRIAITAAVVVMYMVLVGFGVFTSENYGGMSPMAQTLMTSFTSIVGVVVAFYFGASAYIEVQARRTKKGDKDAGQ